MTEPSFKSANACWRRDGLLFFDNDAAVDNDVFFLGVEFGDAALNFLADEFGHFIGVAHAAARGGHEGPDADIDAKTAFDLFDNSAGDVALCIEGGLETAPIFGTRNLDGGKIIVAAFTAAADGYSE